MALNVKDVKSLLMDRNGSPYKIATPHDEDTASFVMGGEEQPPKACKSLVDVNNIFIRDGLVYKHTFMHEMFGTGRIESGSESYAVLWNLLHGKGKPQGVRFGTAMHAYRFRRAEVSDALCDGDAYIGKVRVGIDRPLDFQNTPSEKLDVVLYDVDMNVIAKIAAYDWNAGDIRKHIGDVTEDAVLLCDGGGWHGYTFLYMAAVWRSDSHPYRFHQFRFGFGRSSRSNYFIKVEAPEAVSDLMVGETFDAELLEDYDGFGLSRAGCRYKFADVPAQFGKSLSNLIETGYPLTAVPCVAHGTVRNGDSWVDMIEIAGKVEEEMEKLAHFRRESGLDVRYDGRYETLYLPKVESPYDIPFGVVDVGYFAVPIPGRKNPIIEFRVDGVVVDSARYHDGQKLNGYRPKYEIFKERMGMESVWARLHYNEEDEPYLNIIWTCGTEE